MKRTFVWTLFWALFCAFGLIISWKYYVNDIITKYQQAGRTVHVQGVHDETPPSSLVHIVIATDRRTIRGLLSTIRSVINNSYNPQRLRIYIVCAPGEKAIFEKYMSCMLEIYRHPRLQRTLLAAIHSYVIVEFDIQQFEPGWTIQYREDKVHSDRSSPLNYARLYFHRFLRNSSTAGLIIPQKVVYIDTDLVVLGDVAELYDRTLDNTTASVALAWRERTLRKYRIDFDHKTLRNWNKQYSGHNKEIKKDWPAFNNGIMVQHLVRWERDNITEDINYWVDANRESKLYSFSFNPPFLLGLRNRVETFGKEWNILGLGDPYNFRRPSKKTLEKAKALHWTGRRKPWLEDGANKDLWKPYACSKCYNVSSEQS